MQSHEWKCLYLYLNFKKFVPRGGFDSQLALVQPMPWCQTGDKEFPEEMLTLFTDIYPAQGKMSKYEAEIVISSPNTWQKVIEIHKAFEKGIFTFFIIDTGITRSADMENNRIPWQIKIDGDIPMILDCEWSYLASPHFAIAKKVLSVHFICFGRHFYKNGIYSTHWGRDKIDAISQTIFSDAFSWMEMFVFWLKFHWSLFLRVKLTMFMYWFR